MFGRPSPTMPRQSEAGSCAGYIDVYLSIGQRDDRRLILMCLSVSNQVEDHTEQMGAGIVSGQGEPGGSPHGPGRGVKYRGSIARRAFVRRVSFLSVLSLAHTRQANSRRIIDSKANMKFPPPG